MLLEDGAEIFAKPELMIHADDVQCAHGNTAGGLDETALFYMRSRGVPVADARALLIEAFLVEAVPDGLSDDLRGELTGRISAWLRERSS
jgi:Fe-S cluster assembly protein SufD